MTTSPPLVGRDDQKGRGRGEGVEAWALLAQVLREALAGAELDLRAGRLGLGHVGFLGEGVDRLLAALLGRLDLLREGADAGDGDALVLLQELRDSLEGGGDGGAGLLVA